MKKILFLSLFSYSCIKNEASLEAQEYNSLSLESEEVHTAAPVKPEEVYTMIPFETVNSPCLDALNANLMAAGCSSVYEGPEEENNHTYCETSRDKTSWTQHRFYYILNENLENFNSENEVYEFCSDPHVTLFFYEP